MFRHIFLVFGRDLKVSLRSFMALYIIACPLLFAVLINLFTPRAVDTNVRLALLASDTEKIAWFSQFARVEAFDTLEDIEYRLRKSDHIVAVLPDPSGSRLLTQGNEPEGITAYAKLLATYQETGISIEDTRATVVDYGRVIPPAKSIFVNIALMFIAVLGGMLIALNIVEEKVDNTISAMHVTPVTRMAYILGKSLVGVLAPLTGSIVLLVLTGFGSVNLLHAAVGTLSLAFLSILIGFIQGLSSDDIMKAAGSVKILFLPLFGSAAAVEMLEEKWHPFFYWLPFYWTYRGNRMLLAKTGDWSDVLMHAGITIGLCLVVLVAVAPGIRKGLEKA